MLDVAMTPQPVRDSATRLPPPSSAFAWRITWMTWLPFAIVGVYGMLLMSSRTRPFAVLMAQENYPVEILTFVFLLIGGVIGLRLTGRVRALPGGTLWATFYGIFSVLLLLVAMEEISWGQWFFHFRTPEAVSRINTQHEFNLHNIRGMGGHTEYLRLTFGIGGLIGLALWPLRPLRLIAVPPILWAWFAVITSFAAADLYCDVEQLDTHFAKAMDVMSEVIELMIALAATLYLHLNARRVTPQAA